MDILTKFVAAFGLTLVALLGVMWSGWTWRQKPKRRLHLFLVGITVAFLVVTIALALELGESYDLDAAGWITPIHMSLARAATASLLLPVVTGVQVLRTGRVGRAHRAAALTSFTLIALAAATGFWMVYQAPALV